MKEYNKAGSDRGRSDPLTSNGDKSLASLSLDLDNQWSYMKTHGDAGWEAFPSYLDVFVPNVLDILDQWNLKITFFIVGQDAALDKNRSALKLLTERGHEVGNHSFSHEPWLHLYQKPWIRREVLETESHLLRVTGHKPVGFRGPGFTWNPDLFEILVENGYMFDSSTLPTYLGPLARLYYFWTSDLSKEEKDQRKELFGNFKNGMRPAKAFRWQLASGTRMLEIPVTTMPITKVQFHLSYLLYLSRFSQTLMFLHLNIALIFCRLTRTEPTFLLHPLDFLDAHQVPDLAFFPGMDLNANRKAQLFHKVIKILSQHFELVNMSTHAKSIMKRNGVKVINL